MPNPHILRSVKEAWGIENLQGKSLLDLSCGGGHTSQMLAQYGSSVVATGLPTLEGLVILPGGDLLVAEVFTGRLTRIAAGGGIVGAFFQGLFGPDHMAVRTR